MRIMPIDPVLAIGNGLLLTGFGFYLAFGITYTLLLPWWRSMIGWMFVTMSAAIVVNIVPVLLGVFLGPDYPGRPVIRSIAWGMVAVSGIMTFVTFMRDKSRPIEVKTLTTNVVGPMPIWKRLRLEREERRQRGSSLNS